MKFIKYKKILPVVLIFCIMCFALSSCKKDNKDRDAYTDLIGYITVNNLSEETVMELNIKASDSDESYGKNYLTDVPAPPYTDNAIQMPGIYKGVYDIRVIFGEDYLYYWEWTGVQLEDDDTIDIWYPLEENPDTSHLVIYHYSEPTTPIDYYGIVGAADGGIDDGGVSEDEEIDTGFWNGKYETDNGVLVIGDSDIKGAFSFEFTVNLDGDTWSQDGYMEVDPIDWASAQDETFSFIIEGVTLYEGRSVVVKGLNEYGEKFAGEYYCVIGDDY